MSIVLKGILAIFWLMVIPVFIGVLLMAGKNNRRLEEYFIGGYLFMFSLMELLTLPLTWMKAPLHILTMLYGGIIFFLGAAGMIRFYKQKEKHIFTRMEQKYSAYFWIALLVIAAQIVMCVLMAHMDADDSFYVASATTDIHTDTIFEVNPYNGRVYGKIPSRYVLSPFPVFLAVVSQLSGGLHPAIMAHMVYPAVFLIMAYAVQRLLSRYLYPNDRQARDIYLLIVACICSFSAYSVYNAGCFQMVRIWQGKAVLASVMIPLLIYLCLTIVMEKESGYSWLMLAMADLSCCLLSSMGIMLAPLVIGVFLISSLIFRRGFGHFWKGLLCCLPTVILGMIYLHVL